MQYTLCYQAYSVTRDVMDGNQQEYYGTNLWELCEDEPTTLEIRETHTTSNIHYFEYISLQIHITSNTHYFKYTSLQIYITSYTHTKKICLLYYNLIVLKNDICVYVCHENMFILFVLIYYNFVVTKTLNIVYVESVYSFVFWKLWENYNKYIFAYLCKFIKY